MIHRAPAHVHLAALIPGAATLPACSTANSGSGIHLHHRHCSLHGGLLKAGPRGDANWPILVVGEASDVVRAVAWHVATESLPVVTLRSTSGVAVLGQVTRGHTGLAGARAALEVRGHATDICGQIPGDFELEGLIGCRNIRARGQVHKRSLPRGQLLVD